MFLQLELLIQAPVDSFNLNYNETREGVLQLLSNITTVNVFLSANKWISFRENNFSFSQQKIVLFDLTPIVNQTNETGRSHEIIITAKGDNTNFSETKIFAFIKQFNFTTTGQGRNITQLVLVTDAILKIFCNDNPDSCPTRNKTQIVFVNRTEDERSLAIQDILERTDRVQNRLAGVENTIGVVGDSISNLSRGVEANTAFLSEEKRLRDRAGRESLLKTILKIFLYFIGIMLASVTLFIYVFRKGTLERREMF